MYGLSRNVMAGDPAIFYCGYDMGKYQRALNQLDELITDFAIKVTFSALPPKQKPAF